MKQIKVLTIKQPFASLIADGYKEFEFRTWRTKFRGDFYIHAGYGIDKEAMERFKHLNLEYPTGQIIAKVNLTDCIKVDEEFKEILKQKDPVVYHGTITDEGKPLYGFKMENLEKIEPINAKGKLSFWNYETN